MSQEPAQATGGLAPNAKDIMVFCDGTGKDGRVDKGPPTNVWNLYYFLSQSSEEDFKDLSQKPEMLYIPGIGSGARHISNLLTQMFGAAAVQMVVDAYNYIAKHYKPGDRIWLFGYSRGAYVARKVASLIYRLGLVASEKELRTRWKQHEKPKEKNQPEIFDNSVPIKCLAVWDTVGAVYSRLTLRLHEDALGIPDTELPPNVENALHAVAVHENRGLFKVTLFEPDHTTRLKEIWFPGSHSDVGGGGPEATDLPDASLFWIMDEMKAIAGMPRFKDGYLRTHRLETFKPRDAHAETSLFLRRNRRQTRLESGVLNSRSKIHESMLYLQESAQSCSQKFLTDLKDLLPTDFITRENLVTCSGLERIKQANMLAQTAINSQRGINTSRQRRITSGSTQDMMPPPNPLRAPGEDSENIVFIVAGPEIASTPFDNMVARFKGMFQVKRTWRLGDCADLGPPSLIPNVGGPEGRRAAAEIIYAMEACEASQNIFIFGFGTGAYVARETVNLLAWRLENYSSSASRKRHPPEIAKKEFPIKCMAVWDTTFPIGFGADLHRLIRLPRIVEYVFHALALHENRERYQPHLFEPNGVTHLEEVWFPGSQMDLIPQEGIEATETSRRGLSDIPLLWMLDRMRDLVGVAVDLDKIELSPLETPKLQPQDAYNSSPLYKRVVDKRKNRSPATGTVVVQGIVHTHLGLPTSTNPNMRMPSHEQVVFEVPGTALQRGTDQASAFRKGDALLNQQAWARQFSYSRLLRGV